MEAFISNVVSTVPATSDHLVSLQTAQAQDELLLQVIQYCKARWLQKNPKGPIRKFWIRRNEPSLHNDLLLYGNTVVIPGNLKQKILRKLHDGHQGIFKCRLRAKEYSASIIAALKTIFAKARYP